MHCFEIMRKIIVKGKKTQYVRQYVQYAIFYERRIKACTLLKKILFLNYETIEI